MNALYIKWEQQEEMDGWTDGRTDGQIRLDKIDIYRWMNGWVCGCMDGWIGG
jgi:hypothetical protein